MKALGNAWNGLRQRTASVLRRLCHQQPSIGSGSHNTPKKSEPFPFFPASGAAASLSLVGLASGHGSNPVPVHGTAIGRPLRVLYRDRNGLCGSSSMGRIVMSGSFAQICAELDRMSALETS
ncbi:MAG: hypothetical protein ACT4NV_18540 [Rhodoferax sp.]